MTEDENTKNMFMKVVNSLSFIFGQNPNKMYYVLNEVGSFDKLLILALAANDLELDIDKAYHITKEDDEIEAKLLKSKIKLKEKMGEVIHLWKHRPGSSAQTVNGS